MARSRLSSDTYTALDGHRPVAGSPQDCSCGQRFPGAEGFLRHQADAVVDAVAPLVDSLLSSLARASGRSPEAERVVRFGLPAPAGVRRSDHGLAS